ncbi:hypothetical protein I8748_05715 [Nostoc sp. CENA67]|uniref:Uncharacterized protein n=1 Tax=Amazonocrinis nigriterrae CENA67 TaxID=2794033 RepID=A0A8J7L9N7_9NOST|nr:hypothetical protein [Amazonocrinis nigriterrae CENA67]
MSREAEVQGNELALPHLPSHIANCVGNSGNCDRFWYRYACWQINIKAISA